MQWLNRIVDEVTRERPSGGIIVESGISPSGSYHMGYLREILTCDAIVLELKRRGRQARHIHFVDDQDGFRKVPAGLPKEYSKYLGKPLCDMPAPDGSDQSYADYCLKPFLKNVQTLGVNMEPIRSHQKYREGYFTSAIELVLNNVDEVKAVLESVSGRKLDEQWSPIQVNEEGYLKKRPFVGINTDAKTVHFFDKNGQEQSIDYRAGQVKLDWRLDWPARWWLLPVHLEPFGRDHATKGGSYDTGKALMGAVFKAAAPIPVPYDFVNRAGDTKKMSASKGNGIMMEEVLQVLPPEVVRYFVLRSPPSKQLFFDPENVAKLIDEFAELLAKTDKDDSDEQLVQLCTNNLNGVVSDVPFTHLVASYQAALKNPAKTLEIIARTEHKQTVEDQHAVIAAELKFIDQWLERWAPEEVKFSLNDSPDFSEFSDGERGYLQALAEKIEQAPTDADGEWFHKSIYEFKDKTSFEPKHLFQVLYKVTIGKDSGPRAGWFLSILPRDWLISRLRFEK